MYIDAFIYLIIH